MPNTLPLIIQMGALPQKRAAIKQSRLMELLSLNVDTGEFSWISRPCNRVKLGDKAGVVKWDGYVAIRIDGVLYLAHRLVWLYVHGSLPSKQIDHVNGAPSDNRPSNLREATNTENSRNQKRRVDNLSGYKGVGFDNGRRKWIARITINGKNSRIGRFNSPELASEAYQRKANECFGSFHRKSA